MTPFIAGVIATIVMIVIIIAGLPVAFSMGLVGFMGMVYLLGFSTAVNQIPLTFYAVISDYSLTVLPFFILMGYFAMDSGIVSDLYLTAEKWLRKLPGGLALATIAGCAGFASISGNSMATAATMGTLALPEMRKRGYRDDLSTGSIAAGGTLGFLIPPSVAFVIYGIVAEQSVGRLLMAGFLPGIILTLAFMAIVVIQVLVNPKIAPRIQEPISWKEKLLSLKNVWGVLFVFLLVMGGLYAGFFTPTEAGAVGAFVLLVLTILRKRYTNKILFNSLLQSIKVCCMVGLIIIGAYLFSDFLTIAQVPMKLLNVINQLEVSRYVILLLIVVLYVIMGCFIASIPMIIIAVPVTLPVITSLGFSPLWFGVVAVLMVEASLITPPVGMNVYIIAGISRNIPITTIFKGSLPFLISIIFVVVLITLAPQIVSVLPDMMITR